MKASTLAAALLAAAALALLPAGSMAGNDSCRTETGEAAKYSFGLIAPDGRCMTTEVYAVDPDTAYRDVARDHSGFAIEDITGEMYYGEAVWEIVPLSEAYCSQWR